jgi:hypothetical protein
MTMAEVSGRSLMMALVALDAEISRIKESVSGDLGELEPNVQELFLAYSNAETELKAAYADARKSASGLPPYEKFIRGS